MLHDKCKQQVFGWLLVSRELEAGVAVCDQFVMAVLLRVRNNGPSLRSDCVLYRFSIAKQRLPSLAPALLRGKVVCEAQPQSKRAVSALCFRMLGSRKLFSCLALRWDTCSSLKSVEEGAKENVHSTNSSAQMAWQVLAHGKQHQIKWKPESQTTTVMFDASHIANPIE